MLITKLHITQVSNFHFTTTPFANRNRMVKITSVYTNNKTFNASLIHFILGYCSPCRPANIQLANYLYQHVGQIRYTIYSNKYTTSNTYTTLHHLCQPPQLLSSVCHLAKCGWVMYYKWQYIPSENLEHNVYITMSTTTMCRHDSISVASCRSIRQKVWNLYAPFKNISTCNLRNLIFALQES